eukprot:m.781184 g.781184  ORF g.781184 m.781184 type:complete len:330 (+) comp23285_c2_seq36:67-1056(+)
MRNQMHALLSACACACVSVVFSLDNGLGERPPMGWNSWNLAGCQINESFFRQTVDAVAAKGFLELGYEYINLDDCWMDTKRDEQGNLQWGPNFPTGNTLGDYVHSKGFKFGMYLSAGPKTCSLRDPNNHSATGWGSYGYEAQDALWIAKQGADYLKYDGVCGGDYNMPPLNGSFSMLDWEQVVVSKMGVALNATGRRIWYQYGSPYVWSRHGGAEAGLQWIVKNASLGGVATPCPCCVWSHLQPVHLVCICTCVMMVCATTVSVVAGVPCVSLWQGDSETTVATECIHSANDIVWTRFPVCCMTDVHNIVIDNIAIDRIVSYTDRLYWS